MSLDLCRENALDWCNASNFMNKDGSVGTKCWESSHYQAFTRVSFSIYSHFESILNKDQWKCYSYKSFKQLSVLWYCLISRMFSEEIPSGQEINIYVKLFLSAFSAVCKVIKYSNKREMYCKKNYEKTAFFFIKNRRFQSTEYA